MFVVFDLDDTITNTSHRASLVTHTFTPDWETFYKACVDDEPYNATVILLKSLRATGHNCEIWTGRSEIVRKETEEWFQKHVGFIPSVINMRPKNYRGNNIVLKEQWLKNCSIKPDLVFEDRQDIAEMYRNYGCRVAVFCPKQEAEHIDSIIQKEGEKF